MLIDEKPKTNLENDSNIKNNIFKDLFSTATSRELTGHKKRVYTLDWNMNGTKLASGSVDCNIRIWPYGSDKGFELKGHNDSVTHLKFSTNSNDEHTLISCSNDKTIKLWDERTNKHIKSEKTKGCKNLTWNADSSIFAFSNKDDDMISIYDLRKFQLVKQIEFKNKINEFEFDKTNSILLVTSSSGALLAMNAKNFDEEPLALIDAHFPPVNTININRENTKFATGAADALICLWDMNEMLSYQVIKKNEVPIRKVMFSHDSKLIASIYEGNNLDIFDVNNSECVHTLYTENPQYSIAWHPSSYVLAYCGDDKNRNNIDEGNIHIISIDNSIN